jgi:hypothetical protein
MTRRFRATTVGWWVLIAIPGLLVLLGVWPGLGVYGQGLLPEVLAPESTSRGDFEELARLVRLWCGVALGLACAIGVLFWFSLRGKWRRLLRHFDASKLLGYRGLVWGGRLVSTLLCGALLGLALMAVAPPMRGLSAAAWVVTIALCAAAALLQYLATVFGASETRRLHAGR